MCFPIRLVWAGASEYYSEAPAQTNLMSTLATELPTNGEKHKTNGPANSSLQYAAFHWGYQVGTLFHQCFVKLGPRNTLFTALYL